MSGSAPRAASAGRRRTAIAAALASALTFGGAAAQTQPAAEGAFVLPDAETLTAPSAPTVAFDAIEVKGVAATALLPDIDAAIDAAKRRVEAAGGGWRETDILALRDDITRVYVSAGYVNSGARLSSVSDRTLRFEVVEGVLSPALRLTVRTPRTLSGFSADAPTLDDDEAAEAESFADIRSDPQTPPGSDPCGVGTDAADLAAVADAAQGSDDFDWRPFQLRRSVVANRLNPNPCEPLNVDALNERFQILTNDPTVRRVVAALEPTDVVGQARLTATVDEEPPFTLLFSLASERSPSIGGERASVAFAARNPAGMGDVFAANVGATEGQVDVAAAYDLPVSRRGVALHVFGDFSDAEIVEEPLSDLDVLSQSYQIGGGVSVAALRGVQTRRADDGGAPRGAREYAVVLRGEVAHKHSETDLEALADAGFDTSFDFSPGSVDGVTEVTVATLSARATLRERMRAVETLVAANFGLDGTVSRAPGAPDENFFYLFAQGQAAQRVFETLDHQVILRVEGQYADGTLYPTERYSFGGIGSVRGYRRNQVTADSAFVGSLEYRMGLDPLGRVFGTRLIDDWSIGAFIEGGIGRNRELPDPFDDALLSAGVQLNVSLFDRIDGSIYYGERIIDVADPEDDMFQDSGVGFRITLRGL